MSEKKAKKSVFTSPLLSTKIKSSNVSLFPEAGLGYLLGPLLALISNGVVNIWLIQYWDKVLMLGQWNPLFETLLPILSSVIIIIGNLLVGKLMERKPSIAGKARPFLLLGLPLVAISLLILFLVPLPIGNGLAAAEGGTGGTTPNIVASIFIAVGYNLYYALAWPIYYTSHSALVNLSTRDGGKRGLLSTCIMAAQLGAAGLSGMAGGFLVNLIGLLPSYQVGEDKFSTWADALKAAGNDSSKITTLITPEQANSKWTILMIVMIVCLVIGCLLEYYFTRERITEENLKNATSEGNAEQKGVSTKEQIRICVHDKYWWMIILFFFLYQFGGQMKNNDMSFYSLAFTGDTNLSSLINTIGAIPTTLGMLIVWPLANKFSKSKTIIGGAVVAVLGSLISLAALATTDKTAISAISIASFCVKALGTAPAMYISVALLANVLDHQEAVYGKRTDGFTMAVYGSIMVAMSGVCNGIIAGLNAVIGDGKVLHTVLGFLVEGGCYLLMGIIFLGMNVERYTDLDNVTIIANQRNKCLAQGKEWVEPEERAKREDAENARLVEESRVAQLRADCEKKHLNFEEENNKYLEAKKIKDEKAAEKKAASEAKKAALEEKKKAQFDALPEEKKAAIIAKKEAHEKKVEAEYKEILEKAKASGLAC